LTVRRQSVSGRPHGQPAAEPDADRQASRGMLRGSRRASRHRLPAHRAQPGTDQGLPRWRVPVRPRLQRLREPHERSGKEDRYRADAGAERAGCERGRFPSGSCRPGRRIRRLRGTDHPPEFVGTGLGMKGLRHHALRVSPGGEPVRRLLDDHLGPAITVPAVLGGTRHDGNDRADGCRVAIST